MEELKSYVKKTSKDKIILGLFAAVFAVAGYVLFTEQNWIFFGAMVLGAAVLFIGVITSFANDNKFIRSVENSPERDRILADFTVARSYANDTIRMGEVYIFSKKMTRLLSYQDIRELRYFEHHDPETQSTEPGIAIALSDGKSRTLCDLYVENPQMQAQEIFALVSSKNPGVEIIG